MRSLSIPVPVMCKAGGFGLPRVMHPDPCTFHPRMSVSMSVQRISQLSNAGSRCPSYLHSRCAVFCYGGGGGEILEAIREGRWHGKRLGGVCVLVCAFVSEG